MNWIQNIKLSWNIRDSDSLSDDHIFVLYNNEYALILNIVLAYHHVKWIHFVCTVLEYLY